MKGLIEWTDNGLYCAAGDFYIDPWRPVHRAVITHAHSDHARWGHGSYLCHHHTLPILQARLGQQQYQSVTWGETVYLNGVRVSLHPAGHIIGSSQIRVEHKGEIWVVSGDYKTENDGISGAFEPIRCHHFITECTFGLPIYQWKPQERLYREMGNWIIGNQQQQTTSVFIAYSLGKAQRVVQAAAAVTDRIFVHGAVWNIHQALVQAGIALPTVERITADTPRKELQGAVVVAPASVLGSSWLRRLQPCRTAVCSGWMQVRGNYRRQAVDKGFAISDHADWNGLLQAVAATGAETVYATHGFQAAFSRYLTEQGKQAFEITTEFGGEEGANETTPETEASPLT
ncbi:MAG: ligase-associated DNA damage response exonuclease [Lacibacter sp.]